MIVRRYGSTIQNVTPNFDARAMNEVGFLRDGSFNLPAADFESEWTGSEPHLLSASAEGDVQGDVEERVLTELREKLAALEAKLADGEVLYVENEVGKDQAKTRGTQTTKVVAGENRLYFAYTIDPPLRVSVWRRKA